MKDFIVTVQIINNDDSKGEIFTADKETLIQLLSMATPFKVKFEIQRVL